MTGEAEVLLQRRLAAILSADAAGAIVQALWKIDEAKDVAEVLGKIRV